MAEVQLLKLGSGGTVSRTDSSSDSIQVSAIAISGTGDVSPVTDTNGSIGTAEKRWGNVYSEVVTQGDTAFTDTHCPKCQGRLLPGDSLELYAHTSKVVDGIPILMTVPAHRSCFMARVKRLLRRTG